LHDDPCGVYDKAKSHPASLSSHRGVRVCDLLIRILRKAFLSTSRCELPFALLDVLIFFLGGLLAMPP
jgi:hypothetical protein